MAKNTFRKPPEQVAQKKQRRKNAVAHWFNRIFNSDQPLVKNDVWIRNNIYKIFWIVGMMSVNIYLNFNSERLIRRIHRTKAKVNELRAEYTVLQAGYNKSGRQSEINKRVSEMGLVDNQTPPHKLVVATDEQH